MKKKEIAVDLTSLLDVVLILLFSVLVLNAGQIIDAISRLDESEELRAAALWQLGEAEAALGETEAALGEASLRLDALSDWDSERLSLIGELGALETWRDAAEEAARFVSLVVLAEDGRRMIFVSARPDIEERIEIEWAADGRNIILNHDFVESELSRLLQSILSPMPEGKPALLMLNETGIAFQEFNLVYRALRQFIASETEIPVYLSVHR